MKDSTFDARIVAASPYSDKTNSFVKGVMKQIDQQETATQKNNFVYWLRHLSRPAMALTAFMAAVLLGGAVYAAVHFAPAFIQMLGKETNNRGATEYSVSGFAQCAERGYEKIPERFEIKNDAPKMSDDEVKKVIQAKCELKWLETFPEKNWPKQGPPSESWKEGDTVTYTRLDLLGRLETISEDNVAITADQIGNRTYQAVPGQKITAYAGGEEVKLSDLKKDDAVFVIATYNEPTTNWTDFEPGKQAPAQYQQPKLVGAVAAFKMSLPLEYYREKQAYVTEIPECLGNEGELCPQTPSIDVYPRHGGEGPVNPYLIKYDNAVFREISGEVTELHDDSLKLTVRTGKIYSVTVGDAGFKVYNRDYTGPYASSGIDAHIKVGSHVAIRYAQPKDADRMQITKEQVQMVTLQLEALNIKNGNIKQY